MSDALRDRIGSKLGRTPKIVLQITAHDRDVRDGETPDENHIPTAGFIDQFLASGEFDGVALTDVCVALLHTSRGMIRLMAEVAEANCGVKKGAFIKMVYAQAQMLNEGHPDAALDFKHDVDPAKPRRREPDELRNERGKLTP